MPRQLIYTSSPRGLISGQSGFCTVARSTDLREALVTMLERFSAYHHLSLGTEGRNPVISAARVVDIRGTRYYVLTRIQDAGLDFTNRTNHLAHHLVFEEGELAGLPSPAVILRDWSGWRGAWKEEPRYLDGSELESLSDLPARCPLPAENWARVAGDAGAAAALLETPFTPGAWLVCSPGGESELLSLFAESLQLLDLEGDKPEAMWRVPFTTVFQGQDNPMDFRWRGCWRDSPEYKSALRNPDSLFEPSGLSAPDSPAAKAARTGRIPRTEAGAGQKTPAPEPARRGGRRDGQAAEPETRASTRRSPTAPSLPPWETGSSRGAPGLPMHGKPRAKSSGGGIVYVAIGALVVFLALGGWLIFRTDGEGGGSRTAAPPKPAESTEPEVQPPPPAPATSSAPKEVAARPVSEVTAAEAAALLDPLLPAGETFLAVAPRDEDFKLSGEAVPGLQQIAVGLRGEGDVSLFGKDIEARFFRPGTPANSAHPGEVNWDLGQMRLELSTPLARLRLDFSGLSNGGRQIAGRVNVVEREAPWLTAVVASVDRGTGAFPPVRLLLQDGSPSTPLGQLRRSPWKIGEQMLMLDPVFTNRLHHLRWAHGEGSLRWCLFVSASPAPLVRELANRDERWGDPVFDFRALHRGLIRERREIGEKLEKLKEQLQPLNESLGNGKDTEGGRIFGLPRSHSLYRLNTFRMLQGNNRERAEIYIAYLQELIQAARKDLPGTRLDEIQAGLSDEGTRNQTLRSMRGILLELGFKEAENFKPDEYFYLRYRKYVLEAEQSEWERRRQNNRLGLQALPEDLTKLPAVSVFVETPDRRLLELVRLVGVNEEGDR